MVTINDLLAFHLLAPLYYTDNYEPFTLNKIDKETIIVNPDSGADISITLSLSNNKDIRDLNIFNAVLNILNANTDNVTKQFQIDLLMESLNVNWY